MRTPDQTQGPYTLPAAPPLLAGIDSPEDGAVKRRKHLTVGYCAQVAKAYMRLPVLSSVNMALTGTGMLYHEFLALFNLVQSTNL